MKVKEPTREGAVVKFRVELTAKELEPHFAAAFKKAQKSIKLDGFRPGKVPMTVVEKRFGDAILADSLEDIIEKVYPDALAKTDVKPITPATVEDVDWEKGKPLKFTAVVEVAPEVEANNWKGLEVIQEVPKITDEDVERQLQSMQRDKAIIADREEGEEVQAGDRLTADVQELDADMKAREGRFSADMHIELGHEMMGHGSDEQFLGMKVGETRQIKTHRHTHDKDGKETSVDMGWEVTLKKIEKIELPELDDNFAQMIDDKFSTMDELKKDIREQLENYAKYQADQRTAGRLVDAVVDAHEFDLPPTLVQQTLDEMVKSRMEESNNMIPEQQLREYLQDAAQRQLRWYFLRDKIIEDLGLEATDEDIATHIDNYAASHEEIDAESLKLQFAAGEQRDALANEIVQGKLMEALREGVKMKEQEVDFLTLLR